MLKEYLLTYFFLHQYALEWNLPACSKLQTHCFHCQQKESFLQANTVPQTSSSLQKERKEWGYGNSCTQSPEEEILTGYFRLQHILPWTTPIIAFYPHGNGLNVHLLMSLFTFPSVHPNTMLRSSLKIIFYYTWFGCFRVSTPRGTKGHLSGQRKPLLPITALQALLIKELSLPSSSYYFLRLFFSFPRYLLRPKLLTVLQLCDTRYYTNLSLFWFPFFLISWLFIYL